MTVWSVQMMDGVNGQHVSLPTGRGNPALPQVTANMDFGSLLQSHTHHHSSSDFLHAHYFSCLRAAPTPTPFPEILGNEDQFWCWFDTVALEDDCEW